MPLFECLLKSGVGLGVASEQQAAARIPVEPVHGSRPAFEPERQRLQMVFQAERAVSRAIHWQAGRLVDNNGLTIEKQDAIGQHGVTHR